MNILFVASEINPIVKSGGLADVIGALPKELIASDADVRIALPDYPIINNKQLKYVDQPKIFTLDLPIGRVDCWVSQVLLPDTSIPVYLFKTSRGLTSPELYPNVAEGDQDRFLLFNIAVVEWLKLSAWQPEIVHCHDWMTGSLPTLIQQNKLPYKTLFTIHNLFYQGLTDAKYFKDFGIHFNATGVKVNLLRLGISTADYISTVSPTYAKEILSIEYGCGLEQTLKKRQENLVGILNGIDYDRYSPSHNTHLVQSYSVNDANSGKQENKQSLQSELGLDIDRHVPLYGYVGRLTDQKGLDLIETAIQSTPFLEHGQLVLLGEGDRYWERRLASLAKSRGGNFVTAIKFDEALAHKIYAASDFFLMPSRFEPCGLTQLIAMKFGSLPIARNTGGLADTVVDYSQNPTLGTGILFNDYSAKTFSQALGKSVGLYKKKKQMQQAIQNAMECDYSWAEAATQYLELYRKLVIE